MKRSKEQNKNYEVLEHLINQAWTLSAEEIATLQPGMGIEGLASLLNGGSLVHKPFSTRSDYDIINPDIHLLKIMKQPDFFPYTCNALFGKPDGSGALELAPFQSIVLKELWIRQFPMLLASRGGSKSFLLAIYCLLRLMFTPGSKIIIAALTFRQSKVVFDYMERIWFASPILRDICSENKNLKVKENGPHRSNDKCQFIIGDSVCTALPLGDGQGIRGLRANFTICEEFASIPEEVYSVVLQGFGSVTADPVKNMKDYARGKVLKILGLWSKEMEDEESLTKRGNQSILSGTAYYGFNHFYRYWKEYHDIISSKGDVEELKKILKGDIPEFFDWKDYSIIRLPYDVIPKGYMDEKTIIRAKQTTNTTQYAFEYGAVFALDSEGFFKRSLIESCVVGGEGDAMISKESAGGEVKFSASVTGSSEREYIYGVDPASESDRFAISIVEVHADHRRVVYCWTTGKDDHRERLRRQNTKEQNFYSYCARKIRDLMTTFPCSRLLVDAGGGGIAVREALRDTDKITDKELPIFECIDREKPKITDEMTGLHILEMVNFRNTAWVIEANHGLKKDMEEKHILFPMDDSIALGLAMEADLSSGRTAMNDNGEQVLQIYDSLEACVLEIKDLKDELATIVVSASATGVERFDTPDGRAEGQKIKKGRMRKDRYSALIMANMGARILHRAEPAQPTTYKAVGGFTGYMTQKKVGGNEEMYAKAPAWFKNQLKGNGNVYGIAVQR